MKINKFILIAVITIILLIISALVVLNYIGNNQKTIENIESEEQNIQTKIVETKEVTNSAMYFTVKSCVDKYMNYLSEQNKEAIYNLLPLKYIQENNVNIDNVLEKIEKPDGEKLDLNILEMRVKNDGEDLQTYYICGKIRNEYKSSTDTLITINIDIINKTFTIEPDVIEGVFDE